MKLLRKQLTKYLWVSPMPIIELDLLIAQVILKAISLRRKYQLTYFDSLHAATAILHDGTIISSDKAYQEIKELKTIHPEEILKKSTHKRHLPTQIIYNNKPKGGGSIHLLAESSINRCYAILKNPRSAKKWCSLEGGTIASWLRFQPINLLSIELAFSSGRLNPTLGGLGVEH